MHPPRIRGFCPHIVKYSVADALPGDRVQHSGHCWQFANNLVSHYAHPFDAHILNVLKGNK